MRQKWVPGQVLGCNFTEFRAVAILAVQLSVEYCAADGHVLGLLWRSVSVKCMSADTLSNLRFLFLLLLVTFHATLLAASSVIV